MKYSQGNQDIILRDIFEKIGVTNKECVEVGFNAETLTGGTGSNVARLVLDEGWSAHLFDKDFLNVEINLHRLLLTPENIGNVFASFGVPPDVDYVSIDVDSVDLWLFRALLVFGYRPRVVSVEYNPNYEIGESVTVRPGTIWNNDSCYGASLAALHRVASEFGYQLAAVEPLLDAFFVRRELWGTTLLESFRVFTGLPAHPPATPERIAATMVVYA